MAHIYDLCKGKNICEGGDEIDKIDDGAAVDGKKVCSIHSLLFIMHVKIIRILLTIW